MASGASGAAILLTLPRPSAALNRFLPPRHSGACENGGNEEGRRMDQGETVADTTNMARATPSMGETVDGGSPAGATGGRPNQAGRYRLEGEIARGGMGVVVRAIDPDLNRPL